MFDSEIPAATASGINADGTVKLGSDDKLLVSFYKRAVQDEFQSKSQGTPIFVQKDYVRIIQPGEKDIIDRPVKESDKARWPVKWQAYLQNKEQAADGTPLDHLFPESPEIVATLRAMHIQTVQQLANLSDTAAGNLQFGGDLRKKAQTYLEGAEKGKKFHALEKRIADQDAEIKQLKEQLAALTAAKTKAA
jgi:hypothetical protein